MLSRSSVFRKTSKQNERPIVWDPCWKVEARWKPRKPELEGLSCYQRGPSGGSNISATSWGSLNILSWRKVKVGSQLGVTQGLEKRREFLMKEEQREGMGSPTMYSAEAGSHNPPQHQMTRLEACFLPTAPQKVELMDGVLRFIQKMHRENSHSCHRPMSQGRKAGGKRPPGTRSHRCWTCRL